MSIDLRVKHDLESRRRAVELFDAGVGCKPAAEALSVPRETVREWQWVYRAFGSEALLSMGGKQSRYTFEQRVAAASAVVDGGMAKTDAMAEFGIRSKSPLERWCRLYREGGAEALRPGPKGRPRGSRSKPRARTREQELEERCRRLEAEVAYLKNCAPWSSGTGSDQGGGRGGEGAEGGWALPAPPAGVLGAQEVDLLLRAGAPAEADQARAARRRGRDILAHRQRLRAPADSHVPARRAGRGRGRQDRAQDDARDGHPVRDTPPGLPPPVQLLQGARGGHVRERHREGLRRRGAVAEARHRRHRVQGRRRQGLLGPGARLLHEGDRGERHIDLAGPRPAAQDARPAPRGPAGRGGTRPCTRTWAGSTSTSPTPPGWRGRASPRACRARGTASTTPPPSSSSAT